jgi:hypothetical protein
VNREGKGITKPVRGQDLLDAVQKAVTRDRGLRKDRAELTEIRTRFESSGAYPESMSLGLRVTQYRISQSYIYSVPPEILPSFGQVLDHGRV